MGAMGSGTTLLRLMLDSHENIAIPQETGFMRAYNAHRFIPFKWSGRKWARRLGWSDAELDAQLRAFYETLFMRYAERHGKQRWGEKTPFHTWHVDDMARLFPDAVFVATLRHPGGSVASNVSRFGAPPRKARSHYARYTREIVRLAAAHADRFAVLRYEDLVLQPERAMRELLEWLGEPWDDAVLEHHVVQSGRARRAKVEGKTLVSDAVDVSRIDKWTRTLPSKLRNAIARELGPLAEFLGYDVEDAAVLRPLGDEDALVVPGSAIDARIDRFPGLGLRTQGSVPKFETFYDPRKVTLTEAVPKAQRTAQPAPSPLRRAGVAVVRRLPSAQRRRVVRVARRVLRASRRRRR